MLDCHSGALGHHQNTKSNLRFSVWYQHFDIAIEIWVSRGVVSRSQEPVLTTRVHVLLCQQNLFAGHRLSSISKQVSCVVIMINNVAEFNHIATNWLQFKQCKCVCYFDVWSSPTDVTWLLSFMIAALAIRPFDKVETNIILAINELVFWWLGCLLAFLSQKDKWSSTTEAVYLQIIVTNSMLTNAVIWSKSRANVFSCSSHQAWQEVI